MTECELPDFYVHNEPIACKEHRCCECSAPIRRGEKYFSARGKWDFGIAQYRQHMVCMEACMCIRDYFNDYECIGFGELKEWWEEAGRGREFRITKCTPEKDRAAMAKLRALMAAILKREHQEVPR